MSRIAVSIKYAVASAFLIAFLMAPMASSAQMRGDEHDRFSNRTPANQQSNDDRTSSQAASYSQFIQRLMQQIEQAIQRIEQQILELEQKIQQQQGGQQGGGSSSSSSGSSSGG